MSKATLTQNQQNKKKSEKVLKCGRLQISAEAVQKLFRKLQRVGKNEAFYMVGYEDTVFMKYTEKGEDFFVMLTREDYAKIMTIKWEGSNGYVVMKEEHTVFLHRLLCKGLSAEMISHHLGHRFDDRNTMLEPVTPKKHDNPRTYFGDMVISVK